MMEAVRVRTEQIAPYGIWAEDRVRRDERDPPTRRPRACVAATSSGVGPRHPHPLGPSARLVSAHRPRVPIFALSPGKETVRRCSLMWGVRAASMRRFEVTEDLIADAARRVVELGWAQAGQRSGSPPACRAATGTTSLFQVQTL
jgi:pyruvate kinase